MRGGRISSPQPMLGQEAGQREPDSKWRMLLRPWVALVCRGPRVRANRAAERKTELREPKACATVSTKHTQASSLLGETGGRSFGANNTSFFRRVGPNSVFSSCRARYANLAGKASRKIAAGRIPSMDCSKSKVKSKPPRHSSLMAGPKASS